MLKVFQNGTRKNGIMEIRIDGGRIELNFILTRLTELMANKVHVKYEAVKNVLIKIVTVASI